jgi:hypothetical protein
MQVWLDELKRLVEEVDPDAIHWMDFDEETWHYDFIAGYTPLHAMEEHQKDWV